MKLQLLTDAGSLVADWNVLDGTVHEIIEAIEDGILVEDAPDPIDNGVRHCIVDCGPHFNKVVCDQENWEAHCHGR